jgi:hypothetical protein
MANESEMCFLTTQRIQTMKNKLIIGVHGLANKPSQELLRRSWLSAINEGLEWINAGVDVSPDNFRMFYWADSIYIRPESHDEEDGSPFKLSDTYCRAQHQPPKYQDNFFQRESIWFAKKIHNYLYSHNFTALNIVAKPVVATAMKDLDVYGNLTRRFHGAQTASEYLTGSLHNFLRENRDRSVMLIGHSLGSLIAYETLKYHLDVSVDLLLTIGSPLMLLGFKQGLMESQRRFQDCTWLVVPQNIHAWKNFADWNDPIIMKSLVSLREDYMTKDGKQIVEDALVQNTYAYKNDKGENIANHHKSYGYLRCPEVSAAIQNFLLAP